MYERVPPAYALCGLLPTEAIERVDADDRGRSSAGMAQSFLLVKLCAPRQYAEMGRHPFHRLPF